METILITGGLGFIGSHTCVELMEQGYRPIIVDDLSNSSIEVLEGIRRITDETVPFYQLDVADQDALPQVFSAHPIDAVIHFAGFKAVGESKERPLSYYCNNLNTTLNLLKCMDRYGVSRLVFSSSATVYDAVHHTVLTEGTERWCTNPYGWTKFMSEQIISDFVATRPDASAVLLRYFNPVGAHASGEIGEAPSGVPQNLMPFVTQVAVGIRPRLSVFGGDYETPDGTGVRDYIHITDLARGHVAALSYSKANPGTEAFNLGTGKGVSVLELVHTFSRINGVEIPYEITDRRPGDVGIYYADTKKAEAVLGWKAELSLEEMCASSYRWQKKSMGLL
jgi:UDP-glucose 4-epimerase